MENTEIKEKSEIFPETGFKTSNKQRKNHLQIQLLQGGKGRFKGRITAKEKGTAVILYGISFTTLEAGFVGDFSLLVTGFKYKFQEYF